jgi:hypothetical protein
MIIRSWELPIRGYSKLAQIYKRVKVIFLLLLKMTWKEKEEVKQFNLEKEFESFPPEIENVNKAWN